MVRPDSSKASSAAKLQGVHHIIAVDLSGPKDDIVAALKGIDCVMCILPPHYTGQQIPLADAALKAGVKRFVPNMWSTPCPPKGVMKIREWVSKQIQKDHQPEIRFQATLLISVTERRGSEPPQEDPYALHSNRYRLLA